ncbi:MAG TPA: FAD-dependent oxidoreductase [Phenylobacterium sp.]|uniref:FAD-dependent oxidoreductase n=1 Tax=Phenylobacterium sp. TaxID=1871053 RepID=UPI002C915515|nr:FAD-dependent oxidoreductase [Phenylobacterium sp.]HSV01998.1 FAD-dependent oxidoreductase [Phenylobacterium sp.]
MAAQAEVSGPDLAQGVEIGQLAEGQPLLGHVGDDPVMVVRQGRDIFAVDATCTHYGGPLAEGLVVGDTVRCPWHHACFSLRTGQMLRAPALNPIGCWAVERDGDLVRVREKREPAPAPRRTPAGGEPDSIVVVGGGAAGAVAVETLRHEGYAGRITLLSADASVPVDRPNLSKDYLAGSAPEDWIPLRSKDFYAEIGVELHLETHVSSLDTNARTLETRDGRRFAYDALLLATGAEPVRLPLPGGDRPQVHYLRTLADSRSIIQAAETARKAVVLGASFIGLEVAASLRTRGLEVHVVAPETIPMERVLGRDVGEFVRKLHQDKGVIFHLGKTAQEIQDQQVLLPDAETIAADLVVIGVGVRPDVALAERAGLALDRGVVVDEFLQTSAPGVFAAGDLARWPDPHTGERIRVEHWVVAERQGQTAARNMLGRRERFDAVPFFWSQHYETPINYVGHAERWDEVRIDGDLAAGDCRIDYRLGGRTLAVATIGRDLANLEAELALERGSI